MKILVTGKNGQLGSELQLIAAQGVADAEFVFTDHSQLDITDAQAVMRYVSECRPDLIVNCAAYTAVDRAENDTAAYRVNVLGVSNVADAALRNSAAVVHISTDFVFNGSKRTPYLETDCASPLGAYGATKLQGEAEMKESGVRGIIIRTGWLYSSFGSNFVKTILRLASQKTEISVVADQWGTPTYAADLAEAIVSILPGVAVSNMRSELFNYSAIGETSWWEFADQIVRRAGLKCKVKPISTAEYGSAARRPEYSVLDNTKIRRHFGIEPKEWGEALDRCLVMLNANNSKKQ